MGIRWGFLGTLLSLGLSFIFMILLVFELSNLSFLLSFALLLGCISISTIAISGIASGRKWGFTFSGLLGVIFLVYGYLVDSVFGDLQNQSILIASSAILLVISMINFTITQNSKLLPPPRAEGVEKVEPYYDSEESQLSSSLGASSKAGSNVKKEFTPGKFVASKFGATYHKANCEWANNIKKNNRVWFQTDADAKKAKMKPHSCLQSQ